VAGVIGFYGAPGIAGPYRDPGPTQLADQLTAPVLALMGGAEEGIPLSEVEAFETALTAAGVARPLMLQVQWPAPASSSTAFSVARSCSTCFASSANLSSDMSGA